MDGKNIVDAQVAVVWDPLRRKEVALTPEERVRQWFISVLRDDFKVPMHMMMSEVSMKFGGKPWRADIVIFDRAQKPLAVVECKRPEVAIDQAVLDQAIRYNYALGVRYIIITNGRSTYALRRNTSDARLPDGGNAATAVTFLARIPTYEEMLA